jgi:serine/threonine-protein kinase
MIGSRLGPYEITAKLGEGGMGEVYRATDTKLKREVAIKVLPAAFTEDKERLARFEREAQLLAQLHHPNIASIFGLEESGGTRALVMELVDGPTLADRLEHGALPLGESLMIARQIAEALEEAHEKGIVHRDLKPQNIKAPLEEKVKVLDFGLAKAMDSAGAGSGATSASQLAQSPTLTYGATQLGMILGTAAYMSPEQAAGKSVDRRADIWAFGVVLWEMLSGKRLFEGETVPETLGAVFRQEIDFDALPASAPPAVRRLVERCLERDPKLRLRDIGEARIALASPGVSSPSAATASRPPAAAAKKGWKLTWPWLVLALVFGTAWLWMPRLRSSPRAVAVPARLVALSVAAPANHVLASDETPVLDLSRDGTRLAFEAEGPEGRQLYLRRIDRAEVTPIESSRGASQPFFSPDGRSLAFYINGRIRKLALEGGAVTDVTSVNSYRGATWAEGGWIVFTQTYASGLFKVRESGGRAEPLTTLDHAQGERTHRWPAAIPGTPWVLFTVGGTSSPNSYDDARIEVVNIETGKRKRVFDGAWMARFAPPATLLLQRRSTLLALPFDARRAEPTGTEQVLLDNVAGEPSSGAGFFAAGQGGALAYVPADALIEQNQVVVVEADGSVATLPLPEKHYWYPRFSPDGRSLALDIGSGQGADDEIWRYDFASKGMSRITFIAGSALPAWSPDGRWIAYTGGSQDRVHKIFRKKVEGAADELVAWNGTDLNVACDWTRDGREILATDLRGEMGLYRVPIDGGPERRIAAAPGGQYGGALAPNGRYMAYTSIETGTDEIFVATFPDAHDKWQVSTDGGQVPVWSRDGRSVLYSRDGAIWSVDVDTSNGFHAGTPRELRRGPYLLRTAPFRNFDAGPGGRLALISRRTDVAAPRQLEWLIGWETKLQAPGKP